MSPEVLILTTDIPTLAGSFATHKSNFVSTNGRNCGGTVYTANDVVGAPLIVVPPPDTKYTVTRPLNGAVAGYRVS